ncbi:MAG: pilus assembly protein N-terminal domain-containing protein [Bryobacteraceae bacterium]|jgi:pilus assembly protein CpaC
MSRIVSVRHLAVSGVWLALAAAPGALFAAELQGQSHATPLVVTVGKALVLDNALNIQRVSLANGELAEAVAVNPREVLINGKAPGETTLIIWQQGGPRLLYDLAVRPSTTKLETVRQQIAREMPGQDIAIYQEGENVLVRGTVKDLTSAERVASVAGTLGKVINLLNVMIPPEESQILLKVRFADVDRSATSQLGLNIFSTGAANTIGGVSTQQYPSPLVTPGVGGSPTTFTLTNALNLFMFRPDLNLGAAIEALEAKNLLEILAEPNVLAMNGKQASFISGGEFPVPVVQGGSNIGAVTIQFREFGVRINFLPTITPRGTIRLRVAPEVSSLDYSNAVVLNGFTVPAIATRRVDTEVELESGQSFGIAGLLNNNFNETVDKIPGLGDIPLLGKLFQSRTKSVTNSELLVLVTPELVRPIPAGQALPTLPIVKPFLKGTLKDAPRTPGIETTGPVPVKPERESMPLERLLDLQKKEQAPVPGSAAPQLQWVPMPVTTPGQSINPGLQPTSPPPNGTGQ